MQKLLILTLAVALAALVPAFAQDAPVPLAPDPGMDVPTCGSFRAQDLAGQVEMLRTIQPLGDEIDPNDAGAARQWAAEVSEACGDDGERPLADAARQALGG